MWCREVIEVERADPWDAYASKNLEKLENLRKTWKIKNFENPGKPEKRWKWKPWKTPKFFFIIFFNLTILKNYYYDVGFISFVSELWLELFMKHVSNKPPERKVVNSGNICQYWLENVDSKYHLYFHLMVNTLLWSNIWENLPNINYFSSKLFHYYVTAN